MTAEPRWPGDGPNLYHPGCWKSAGTWTVWSAFSPSSESDVLRPMAGMLRLIGTDREAGSTTGGEFRGAGPPKNGPGSHRSPPWRPRPKDAAAARSKTNAVSHQRPVRRLPPGDGSPPWL